jgi:uncharacterized protein with NAD-binding domain and iron-sulfur cluster
MPQGNFNFFNKILCHSQLSGDDQNILISVKDGQPHRVNRGDSRETELSRLDDYIESVFQKVRYYFILEGVSIKSNRATSWMLNFRMLVDEMNRVLSTLYDRSGL